MLKDNYFRVADFTFDVRMPEERDAERLLPSFRPFRCDGHTDEELLFRFTTVSASVVPQEEVVLLEESVNDIGHTRLMKLSNGYRVEIRFTENGAVHLLHTDSRFMSAIAEIRWEDPHASEVLSSMLRIVFSQAVVYRKGISIHAAAVTLDSTAYLFTGKSGTGKSTHASLWRMNFPGCRLLNDDNPAIRIIEGKAVVYGTPWSGKTPCYKNLRFSIGGIARLRQTPENCFVRQSDVDAFITLLPGCSAIHQDGEQYGALCDTLAELAGLVPIGVLECLPDREAAILCREELMEKHPRK